MLKVRNPKYGGSNRVLRHDFESTFDFDSNIEDLQVIDDILNTLKKSINSIKTIKITFVLNSFGMMQYDLRREPTQVNGLSNIRNGLFNHFYSGL